MEALRYVDVFLPNQRELLRIAKSDDLEEAVRRVGNQVPVLVVKMGPKGAMAVEGQERLCVPAIPVEFVDPVGAGDSFDAGFLSQYVRGADLSTCVLWGNITGAFSTTRAGGTEAFRDREALPAFLRKHMTRQPPTGQH